MTLFDEAKVRHCQSLLFSVVHLPMHGKGLFKSLFCIINAI